MRVYNKLVRDKIPEIIEADGKVCRTHILSNEEYIAALETQKATLEEQINVLSGNASGLPAQLQQATQTLSQMNTTIDSSLEKLAGLGKDVDDAIATMSGMGIAAARATRDNIFSTFITIFIFFNTCKGSLFNNITHYLNPSY